MSGHGRGAAEAGGHRITVEMRSVNHRFLDLKVRAVGFEGRIDETVLQAIRRRAERGSFAVLVRDESGAGRGTGFRLDAVAARQAYEALDELRRLLGLDEPVPLALVAAQPNVLVPREAEADGDALPALVAACDAALLDLVAMRRREGQALATDLLARLARLETLTEEIAAHAAATPAELHGRLADRIARLLAGGDTHVDESRLAAEVALLADRADVTEELVRLRAHLAALQALVAQDVAVGRRMDFLVQEIGREVNTIGSKSPSIEVSRRVVEVKAEVEKVREQVQNVE